MTSIVSSLSYIVTLFLFWIQARCYERFQNQFISFFEYKPDVMKGFKTNLLPPPHPHPPIFFIIILCRIDLFCVNSFNHWVTDNRYLPNENIPTYLYKCMGAGIWIEINFLALKFSGKNWAPFYDLCFKPILTIFLSYYLSSGFYMNVMLLLVDEVFLITLSVLRFVVFNLLCSIKIPKLNDMSYGYVFLCFFLYRKKKQTTYQ